MINFAKCLEHSSEMSQESYYSKEGIRRRWETSLYGSKDGDRRVTWDGCLYKPPAQRMEDDVRTCVSCLPGICLSDTVWCCTACCCSCCTEKCVDCFKNCRCCSCCTSFRYGFFDRCDLSERFFDFFGNLRCCACCSVFTCYSWNCCVVSKTYCNQSLDFCLFKQQSMSNVYGSIANIEVDKAY